jgi:hypothetical protein
MNSWIIIQTNYCIPEHVDLKHLENIFEPYDDSLWEKINAGREKERTEKNTVNSGHLVS